MQHHRILLTATVLALLVPAASATWMVNGGFEPDTPQDVLDARMHTEPDTSPSDMKLFFNVIPSDRNSQGRDFNPNVGALGSRYLPAGQMGMSAWLGVWKDCNRDGYVGMAETAATEYRSELLLDDSVCPKSTSSSFHRGDWVSEFVYISPYRQSNGAALPRLLQDAGAKVWGDFGRPGFSNEVHYDCAQVPLPSGTLDSSGGLLRYFDCQLGYAGARTVNDVDGILDLGIAYEDVYHPERDCTNPLYVHIGMYGEDYCDPEDPGLLEGNSTAIATVWDCDSGQGEIASVPDPRGGSEPLQTVYAPPGVSPSGVDPDASAWSTYQRNVQYCRDTYGGGLAQGLLGADFSGTNPSDGKRLADFVFSNNPPANGTGTIPAQAGIRGVGSGAWDSDVTYLPPTYLGGTLRSSDLAPAGGIWFTFYAYVSQSTLDATILPQEVPAFYGAAACGDHQSGLRNGWDCDITHWWNPEMGGTADPDGPRPGDAYHLRDTDCYDGSLSEGSGVHASLAPLSDDPPCPVMGTPILG